MKLNNFFLIGMMGVGKTTIAKKIAQMNKMELIELDELITKHAKMSIPEIFAKYGEKKFREYETLVLKKVTKKNNAIISCGGGIITIHENVDIMQKNGITILITRPTDLVVKSIDCTTRPLLKDGPDKYNEILEKRKNLYLFSANVIVENNSTILTTIKKINTVIFSKNKIGYQGLPGAYSWIAANKISKNKCLIKYATFTNMIYALKNKIIDQAVIPMKNSIAGIVKHESFVKNYAEKNVTKKIKIPINHFLLSKQNNLKEIKNVYSHPSALEQCSNFIKKNNLNPVIELNTAIAASKLNNGEAAIASQACAKLYKLNILAKNIQNMKNNFTEFYLIK